jgi:cytochrome oxidase Cu insertion factor (SCO1/SenC/PrrC family)
MSTSHENDAYGNRLVRDVKVQEWRNERDEVEYAVVYLVVHDGVLIRDIRNGETPESVAEYYRKARWTDHLCLPVS